MDTELQKGFDGTLELRNWLEHTYQHLSSIHPAIHPSSNAHELFCKHQYIYIYTYELVLLNMLSSWVGPVISEPWSLHIFLPEFLQTYIWTCRYVKVLHFVPLILTWWQVIILQQSPQNTSKYVILNHGHSFSTITQSFSHSLSKFGFESAFFFNHHSKFLSESLKDWFWIRIPFQSSLKVSLSGSLKVWCWIQPAPLEKA